ncbi:hypothetical protein ACQWF6_26375, partial [Salmonella enterica subsp. enterica serovar Infantis]
APFLFFVFLFFRFFFVVCWCFRSPVGVLGGGGGLGFLGGGRRTRHALKSKKAPPNPKPKKTRPTKYL